MAGYDLHIHSTASDGTYSVEDIVIEAKSLGLDGVAITDHDTVDGLFDLKKLSNQYKFPIIPGIEISTMWQGREIHILGYCFDINNKELTDQLAIRLSDRYRRVESLVDKLVVAGYDITMDEVKAVSKLGVIGKPHVAAVLVSKKAIPSVEYAFSCLFRNPFFGSDIKSCLSPFDAIELIANAGGLSVLAHPGRYKSMSSGFIVDMKSHGLNGIEARYINHHLSDEKYYMDLAYGNDLFITGGSDFHGYNGHGDSRLGSRRAARGEIWQILRKYENYINVE